MKQISQMPQDDLVSRDPIDRFTALFARAGDGAPFDHTAMALATADADGRPGVRIVLLHGLDARGFVIITNYASRKGRDIAANPQAALCFYWPWLDEQVRIEGRLSPIDAAESDAYFATRPRGKQVGAWASPQSRPLASRAELELRCAEIDRRFADQTVPRPPFWGGFRLVPDRLEFWKAGESRLHDRVVYTRDGDGWKVERLAP
jgi:pyridoxamine 5'-phosphate oxidase